MSPDPRTHFTAVTRRRFVQYLAMLSVGGRTFWGSGDVRAAVVAARDAASPGSWPARNPTG